MLTDRKTGRHVLEFISEYSYYKLVGNGLSIVKWAYYISESFMFWYYIHSNICLQILIISKCLLAHDYKYIKGPISRTFANMACKPSKMLVIQCFDLTYVNVIMHLFLSICQSVSIIMWMIFRQFPLVYLLYSGRSYLHVDCCLYIVMALCWYTSRCIQFVSEIKHFNPWIFFRSCKCKSE